MSEKKLKKEKKFNGTDFTGGVVAGSIASSVPALAMVKNEGSDITIGQLANSMNYKNLPQHVDIDSPLKSMYVGGKYNVLFAPKTAPGLMAHELSHANSKMLKTTPGVVAYTAGKPAGIIGMIRGAYTGSKDKNVSMKERIVQLAATSPMLFEETMANTRAAQALLRTGGKKALLKAAPNLLASESSYLANSFSGDIGNYMARKIKDIRSKKKENK